MGISRSYDRLEYNKEHPCICHDKFVVFVDEEIEHVKRNYYEVITQFKCSQCECVWNRVTWLVGQHDWIEIVKKPMDSDEE